jgi:chromosome segregation ATPase
MVLQSCELLTEDIKKAIKAMKEEEKMSLPNVCSVGNQFQCSEDFIRGAKESMEKLHDEIDVLTCQLHGKKIQQENVESALDVCNDELAKKSSQCEAAAAAKKEEDALKAAQEATKKAAEENSAAITALVPNLQCPFNNSCNVCGKQKTIPKSKNKKVKGPPKRHKTYTMPLDSDNPMG